MDIIFRYDDFSGASPASFETDRNVFELFLSLGIPLVVGLTANMSAAPRDAANTKFFRIEDDAKRVELLKRGLDAGWQLAVHGYTHQRTAHLDGTEFSGLSIDAQERKIREACSVIDRLYPNARPTVFIPPWNNFDRQTLRCVQKVGFKTVCAGNLLPWSWPSTVNFVPSIFSAADLVQWLKRYGLAELARMVGDAPVVITFHPYEINDPTSVGYIGVEKLREILEFLAVSDQRLTILRADMSLTMTRRLRYGAVMAKLARGNSEAQVNKSGRRLTLAEAIGGVGLLLDQAMKRPMSRPRYD